MEVLVNMSNESVKWNVWLCWQYERMRDDHNDN